MTIKRIYALLSIAAQFEVFTAQLINADGSEMKELQGLGFVENLWSDEFGITDLGLEKSGL